MRILPSDIRQKLLERFQVESMGAKPNLRLVATQSAVNTLLTEDIVTDVAAGFGDVAIRQLEGESSPSRAYAVCLDEGTANIYERAFPTDIENPWELAWSLGEAHDVAIEFDGLWRIDQTSRCYELITETTPYIFFTDTADTLYVQKWRDASGRLTLAENASHISVCRSWRSTLDTGVDQGLVIGYLRNGKVFYRTYAQQPNGECEWEVEREITELGEGNETLSLFRTNDFRLGFLTENAGQITCALTYRTYAGQTMPAEHADTQAGNGAMWLEDAVFRPVFTQESAEVVTEDTFFLFCDADDVFGITDVDRLDSRHLLFTLGSNACGDILPNIGISPEREILSAVFQDGNKLLLTLGEDIAATASFDISVVNARKAWWVLPGGRMAMADMTFHAEGRSNEGFIEDHAAVTADCQFTLVSVTSHDGRTAESACALFTGSFVLQPVSISPI